MSIWQDPVLETVPDVDLSELLEATAQNADDGAPPLLRYTRRRAPAEQIQDWGTDEDPVRRGVGGLPTSKREDAPRRVQEAAVWKTDSHPRWPKGTPGGKGGEFIHVGEYFTSGGKRWQVAHIVKGKIYAHEASAKYSDVQTKAFDVGKEADSGHTIVPGIEHEPAPKLPKGGKTASTVTVVDPYVDPATHDPSIPVPEGSHMSPEQWKRFGKVDQEHYTELMERFGAHKPGAAQAHVNAAYKAYQGAVANLVKDGYSNQYGSSSGFSLSLAAGHHNHAVQDTDEMRKLREKALALQAEHMAAVQWDLYNRALAPDIFSVHKSTDWSAEQWHDYAIAKNNPVFSGLSQSWSYRRAFFGKPGIATPLAIRHVLMSTASAHASPSANSFSHEIEISVPVQMKMDKRSLALTALSGSKHSLTDTQMTWLEGVTSAEPQSGAVLEQLRDAMENGTHLPVPPAPASIKMDGAGGKTWADPPPEAAAPSFAPSAPDAQSNSIAPAELPKDLPWKHTEDGGIPKAVTGEEAGAQAGQYFMGLKGTLYWIGNDPGVGGGYPFRIHKIVGGKFNGEDFPYNPSLPGYYLDASHEEVLPQPEDLPKFEPSAWAKSTDTKFLEEFQPGEKFKLNGTPYEVTGKDPYGGGMKIKDLDSGLTGQINGDYKSSYLVPFDGSADADGDGHVDFAEGDHIVTPDLKGTVTSVDGDVLMVESHADGKVYDVPSSSALKVQAAKPVVGMTFPMSKPGDSLDAPKVKATVTKLFNNGDVQVNLKPGVVLIPTDEWGAHGISAYDPSAHTIGEKAKLRDLKPGDRFHGSAGNQTHRPYEVLYQNAPQKGGKTTFVRNLDTGEVLEMSAHKSYPTLDHISPDKPVTGSAPSTPGEPTAGGVGPDWDPAKFELSGDKVTVQDMQVGTIWKNPNSGMVMKKIADNGDYSTVSVLDSGTGNLIEGHEFKAYHHGELQPLPVMQPKLLHGDLGNDAAAKLAAQEMGGAPSPDGVMPQGGSATDFDPSSYIEGAKMKIGQMTPGSIFKTVTKGGAEKHYQLSDDGSSITNLLTGKVYPAKPHYKATPLAYNGPQKPDAPSEDPTIKYPAGSTVFFNPATKETGLDHAVVIGYDPHSKQIAVKSPDTGNTVYVGAEEISRVKHPSDAEPAAPEEPAAGTVPLHSLKPGDKYEQTPGSGVGQVVKNENGELYVKSAAMEGQNVVGIPVPKQHHGIHVHLVPDAPDVPDEKAGNQKTASPIGTNTKGLTFGEMPEGTVFSPAHNGIKYKKTSYNEAQKIDPGAVVNEQSFLSFKQTDVPDDVHVLPATQDTVGKLVTVVPDPSLSPSLAWTGSETGHVQKVREADGAVQLFGSMRWHKPEYTTVHDSQLPVLKSGDQVTYGDGAKGTFVDWSTGPSGKPEAIVDTDGNMDTVFVPHIAIHAVEPGDGHEQTGQLLHSKAHAPVPHEQLTKGDVTTMGTLKPGDQFKPAPGLLYQVVSQPPEDADYQMQHATVAQVLPDGGLATPVVAAGLVSSDTVTFHAKAEDVAPVEAPPLAQEPTDYPDAAGAGLVGFTDSFGGPYAHTMVGSMPQGTVFEDAAGNVWKVKVSGAHPVITGGAAHYTVDPATWGKDLAQPQTQTPTFTDHAGPIGGGYDANTEVAAAEHELVSNPGNLGIIQLQLNKGDFIQTPDGVMTYKGLDGGNFSSHVFENTETGQTHYYGPYYTPDKVSPTAFVPKSGDPFLDSLDDPAPTLYTEPTPLSAVKSGQKFTHGSGSSDVYTMINPAEGSHSASYTNSYGDDIKGNPDMPVFVAREPDEAPAAAPVPEAPTADPSTLPPVEGPNGFAPEQAAPVLDPNFSPENTLDPFLTHTGSGGAVKYPRLNETQVGQLFTDKSGTDYRVVEHGSAVTVYENVATGAQHSAPSDQRVKLTALPPDPGPNLKGLVLDLTTKYGSLENVPKLQLNPHTSTYASDGKTKNPRLGFLKYGENAYDADGYGVTFLASWLDRALVLDLQTNEVRIAPARARVTRTLE